MEDVIILYQDDRVGTYGISAHVLLGYLRMIGGSIRILSLIDPADDVRDTISQYVLTRGRLLGLPVRPFETDFPITGQFPIALRRSIDVPNEILRLATVADDCLDHRQRCSTLMRSQFECAWKVEK